MNPVNTTQLEEAYPGSVIEYHVEVIVVVEEETVFFLPNKVEETEETEVKGQFSQGQMRQTPMRPWQE